MENEIWRSAVGYEGYYEVSNFSHVRSVKRTVNRPHLGNMILQSKPMKILISKKGYPVVYFCINGKKKTVTVHRLVANAFIENPFNYKEINHKDANKLNSSISNLEWVTHAQNIRHAYDLGLVITKGIPVTKAVIALKGDSTFNYSSIKEAALSLNLSAQDISDVLHGRNKTTKGYRFEFCAIRI